jgi:uncharacterized membrane protein
MIRTKMTTLIRRTPTVVFDYCSDLDNLPAYDRRVISAKKTSSGPIGLGSTWTHERTQGPQKMVLLIELVEFDAPKRLVFVSSGGVEVRSPLTFEAAGDGATTVTDVLEVNTKGFMRLLEPLMRRQIPTDAAKVHERLKQIIEALPNS